MLKDWLYSDPVYIIQKVTHISLCCFFFVPYAEAEASKKLDSNYVLIFN